MDLLEDVFCQTQLSANAVLSGSECPRFSTPKMTCTHVLLILKIMVASSCFCLPSASSHCHCVAVNKSILFFFSHPPLAVCSLNPLFLLVAVLYRLRVYNRNS